jgi:outer membrane protein assembly factor BamA
LSRQFISELAGLGGDTNFVKFHSEQKIYLPLNDWLSIGVASIFGYLRPFTSNFNSNPNTNGRVLLNDKLYFGHPLTMRGFEQSSLGPRIHFDNIGGDVAAAASVAAIFKIPNLHSFNHIGGRLQFFLNAANVFNLHHNNSSPANVPLQSSLREFIVGSRVSLGLGLAIPSPVGRLEFNVQYPLRFQSRDRLSGFQFGIGIQYC